MRTRALLPALVATLAVMSGSAAMAATATTVPATPATVAAKTTTAKAATKAKVAAPMKVDVNTASSKALRALPGVGPKLASEIIAGRPYKNATVLTKHLDKYLSSSAAQKLETHFSY